MIKQKGMGSCRLSRPDKRKRGGDITFHGVAINVNTDLDYFKLINPRGITKYPAARNEAYVDIRHPNSLEMGERIND